MVEEVPWMLEGGADGPGRGEVRIRERARGRARPGASSGHGRGTRGAGCYSPPRILTSVSVTTQGRP